MSSFLLKIIACFTMLIDHIGIVFFPTNSIFRIIGRIAMPIFAFQVGIGYKYTKSKLKYILRMFICGLIAQIPFLLMLNNTMFNTSFSFDTLSNFKYFSLNICFSFIIALAALYFIEEAKKQRFLYVILPFLLLISVVLPLDYGIWAVLLVILSYFSYDKKAVYFLGMLFISMVLALPFLLFFNKKQGPKVKYLFYLFYPLHMFILFLLKISI